VDRRKGIYFIQLIRYRAEVLISIALIRAVPGLNQGSQKNTDWLLPEYA
jgi:hypothetical protein